MRWVGLDGREYRQALRSNPSENPSSYHLRARELLTKLFPVDLILEEVSLPGSRLTADFLIPGRKILAEAQGHQHYEYTPFFHKNRLDFLTGKKNDRAKRQWADLNGLMYVELPWFEADVEWTRRILTR